MLPEMFLKSVRSKVVGKEKRVNTLVDTEADHNVIWKRLADEMGLKV